MKKLVARFGWPTATMVGKDAARAAWLVAQHADQDVEFQEKCLALMQAHAGTVSPADLAYLTDRVRVNQGKPQLYGTQFHVVEGVRVPRPIESADTVDQRRKKMGMMTLEEYTDFLHS